MNFFIFKHRGELVLVLQSRTIYTACQESIALLGARLWNECSIGVLR